MDKTVLQEQIAHNTHLRLEVVAAPIAAALLQQKNGMGDAEIAKRAVELAIVVSDEARKRAFELAGKDLAASGNRN